MSDENEKLVALFSADMEPKESTPVNPYAKDPWEFIHALHRARAKSAEVAGEGTLSRMYIGYYERRAMDSLLSRTGAGARMLFHANQPAGKRSEFEGMQVFTVDAYSHLEVA